MTQDYATDFWRDMDDLHGFSFYRKPIQNIEPCRAITVVDVYRYLVGLQLGIVTDKVSIDINHRDSSTWLDVLNGFSVKRETM